MDIESIGFAIQTTVVGMLIVFGFLSFLAVTMVLLSRVFRVDGSSATTGLAGADASAGADMATDSGLAMANERTNNPEIAGVIVAAAAAFIEHEQRSSEVSAAQWNSIASGVRVDR